MRFITSSRKSEGISNSAIFRRPISPIYIRSFIGAAYRRISRAPCATSTSRRTDGGGSPISTAISFAPSTSQATPVQNAETGVKIFRNRIGREMTHASRQMSSLQCRIVHQQFARARVRKMWWHDFGPSRQHLGLASKTLWRSTKREKTAAHSLCECPNGRRCSPCLKMLMLLAQYKEIGIARASIASMAISAWEWRRKVLGPQPGRRARFPRAPRLGSHHLTSLPTRISTAVGHSLRRYCPLGKAITILVLPMIFGC